jgi:ATP-binding cassette, subfamily B, bacterial
MKLLMQYLGRYTWLIVLALFLATINQVFSLFDPYIFGHFVINKYAMHARDYDQPHFIWGVLGVLGLLIGTAMVSRIGKAFQDYVTNVIIQKFGVSMYTDGLRHAMRLPYQDFEDQRSGETLSVLQKVRTDTASFINSFINIFFMIVISAVFVMIYALTINSWLIVIYLVGALVLSWLTLILSKKIKSIQKNIVRETNALAGATTESLRNIELVKSLGLTNQEILRLNDNSIKILNLELKKVRSIRSISFVQGTVVNLLRQTIVFSLLYFIFKGQLDVGKMITMQFYSFFLFGPLQEIGTVILSYREAQASLNNMKTLLAKPVEVTPEHPAPINAIESLRFDNVRFQHLTATRAALENVSFEVNIGETVAFVGPSGAGKTTLVKLLVGLYHPNSGHVFYNDLDGAAIDFEELRRQTGLVTQDPQLFSGTIRENLLFVNPTVTEELMMKALNQAACQNLLARAENGLDTVIGEGGLKLSGGERQRLSIARALVRNPRMMIFDEATSALDSLTEEEISQTIRAITSRRQHITIMIAHRLSTIMHADRIYVLEKGNIVETGSHQALVEEKGLYYAMWRQQIGERKDASRPAAVKVN